MRWWSASRASAGDFVHPASAAAWLSAPITGGIDAADFQEGSGTFTRANIYGSDIVTVGENLLSLDDASTAAAPRVYRLVRDGSFEPSIWDAGSAYPATGMHAIAYDGTSLVYSTRAAAPTRFFSLSPTAPGPAVVLGDTSEVRDVSGIAADATYFYVAARTDATAATEGIFRLERANLSAPAPRRAPRALIPRGHTARPPPNRPDRTDSAPRRSRSLAGRRPR